MNPMQCRGQVEGGVAQALGATLFRPCDGPRRSGAAPRGSSPPASRPASYSSLSVSTRPAQSNASAWSLHR
ncbi:hypothetical protein [Streptomyces sp. NPDC093093]|uniref:hypothetical protein n=1 Tax=Streptomyces sp. NPDC093093 TaxID=3366025 RepID=UPI00382B4FB5